MMLFDPPPGAASEAESSQESGKRYEGIAFPNERLDAALTRASGLSRSFVENRIRDGGASVDGQTIVKPGLKLKARQRVAMIVPPVKSAGIVPEDMRLSILYEDEYIAIIDKPAGLVVHPAAGHDSGTLVNGLLAQLDALSGIGGEARPGIVHRLDKDTSGLMMVAKNDSAHIKLCEMLAAREIHKTYIAVVHGAFEDDEGRIDAPIGRHHSDRKKMAVTPNGKEAVTLWRLRQPLHGASVLDVDIITGRTHQIRVHMASKGHAILGDTIYGHDERSAPRLMLHARRLVLAHPISGNLMTFQCEPPLDFLEFIGKLR